MSADLLRTPTVPLRWDDQTLMVGQMKIGWTSVGRGEACDG